MTCCNVGEEKKIQLGHFKKIANSYFNVNKEEADQYYLFVPMIDISVKLSRIMQNCGPFYVLTFYGTTFIYLFIFGRLSNDHSSWLYI